MRNKTKPVKKYILALIFFLTPISVQATEYLNENWDIGQPPANFPCWESECGSDHTWRGWEETGSSHHEEGNDCELSTSTYHSPPRSLHQVRSANQYRVMNQQHDIPGNPTKIYLHFYIYFSSNWENFHANGESEFVHLIFTNTARSGEGFRINLRHHSGDDYPWKCTYGMFLTLQDGSDSGPSNSDDWLACFDFKDHLQEWVYVVVMADAANDKVSMWINNVNYINEADMAIGQGSFNNIIISGYSSPLRDWTGDFYIDDIVIADSYTDPIEDETPPLPPKNIVIVE
ncbi:MAG: hypothetical protein ACFFAE_12830 [Candidatus Hodarchaeota archaeon]